MNLGDVAIKNFGNDYPISKQWDSYRDVETDVKNMNILLPIIDELHAPEMRPSHWQNVAKICKHLQNCYRNLKKQCKGFENNSNRD